MKKTPAGGKAIRRSSRGKTTVLLVTALLVALALLMGVAGTLSAINVVATVSVGTNPRSVGYNPTTNKVYVANTVSNNVTVIDGTTDTVIGSPIAVGSSPVAIGVNPIPNKIYVSNYSGNNVTVIDGTTDTIVGSPIAVGSHPNGVGVNPTTNKIYVSNYSSNNVTVIDGATDTVIGSPVSVGTHPYGVGVNPTTNKNYVINYSSNNVTVINGATDTVVGSPIAVGSSPASVCVNPTTSKIYVANFSSNNVTVINGATDTVVGSPIAVGSGPDGVGVNPATNKIYVANQLSDNVTVINGATDTVIGSSIAVGVGPFGVGVNPTTNKIYVVNRDSNTVSVICDPETVNVGSIPYFLGVNPTTNKIYVANMGSDTVSVINGATDTVIGSPIGVGSQPYRVGVNPTTNKIYVANYGGDTVSVINGATDIVIGSPIAAGSVPGGVGVNPVTNKIYVANHDDNTISVINGATDTVVGSPIAVGTGPGGVGVNPITNRIYVANVDSDTVSVINGATDAVVGAPIAVGTDPYDLGVNLITNRIYVANYGSNTVSVINGATDTVVGSPIAVGTRPGGIAANPTTNKIYVSNSGSDNVSVINGATYTTVGSPIAVGSGPYGVGANPTTDKIYVSNIGSNTVSVICDPSAPTTASLNPDRKTVGEAGFPLTVNGTGFIRSTVVRWNGADRTTTYVSDTQVTASIPATDVQTAGAALVTAVTPGGGQSNAQTFTVNNPVPTTTFLNPTSRMVGSGAFTLTVNGTNFVPTSVVNWNGSARITTYVSATRVTAAVLASDITGVGTANVTVFNPTPGGETSNAQTFTINPIPVPTVTGLSPTSKIAGQPGFTLTVNGTNFVAGSVVRWNASGRTTTYVSPTRVTAVIPSSDVATDGSALVTVFNPAPGGGTSNTQTFTINSVSASWYLAEGTTAWGFNTYISIENPNTSAVHAEITYMTGSGNVSGGTITLPASSQTTVNPAGTLGNKDFSTKVTCTEGKTIAVDRTMSWTGPGAVSPEGHSSVGVTAPAKTWYLPEGCSAFGFETWLLIQNPNGGTADCTVTYMIEGEAPVTTTHTVPGNSRQSFNMETDIGAKNASIKVASSIPVIPERAMYRNNKREGHDSIGTTTSANDYFLAEGTTAWGFTTWVLIQNPASSASNVTITYMTPSGKKAQAPFSLAGNSRKTIKVNDVAGMGNTDFSTQVHGSKAIIAERSMYWDNGTGEACHDSIGMDQAHTTFYLPDGQTSGGYETWTLVQNPNASAVNVEVSYLKAGGGAVSLTSTIPANSRMTFNMADKVSSGRASIMVTAKNGKKIMVERAMYWNNKGAGTDTIGGFSD